MTSCDGLPLLKLWFEFGSKARNYRSVSPPPLPIWIVLKIRRCVEVSQWTAITWVCPWRDGSWLCYLKIEPVFFEKELMIVSSLMWEEKKNIGNKWDLVVKWITKIKLPSIHDIRPLKYDRWEKILFFKLDNTL